MSLLNKPRVFKLIDKKIKVIFTVNDADCQDLSQFVDRISENNLYFSNEISIESLQAVEKAQVMLYGLGQWKTFDIDIEVSGTESTQSLTFKVKNCEQEVFRKELLLAKTI